ncbi:MAG: nucleotidyltransferase domain-containing protein [Thermodesulfobacteriota bacterium]
MLRWPDKTRVDEAVRVWASDLVRRQAGIVKIGYFGSYARGDWGVGSDLDLVAIVDGSTEPFGERARTWDLSGLPVHADLLIYTSDEWDQLRARGGRFARTLELETIWVHPSIT